MDEAPLAIPGSWRSINHEPCDSRLCEIITSLVNQLQRGEPITHIEIVRGVGLVPVLNKLTRRQELVDDQRAQNLIMDYILQHKRRDQILTDASTKIRIGALRRGVIPPRSPTGRLIDVAMTMVGMGYRVDDYLIIARLLTRLGELPQLDALEKTARRLLADSSSLGVLISDLLEHANQTYRREALIRIQKATNGSSYGWWLTRRYSDQSWPALDAAVGRNLAHYLAQRI